MSDSTQRLERKLRKLLRDPKLFFSDAIRKRMPARMDEAFRPFTPFDGSPPAIEFSSERLVEAIARRFPVLHTTHEEDFSFGVLEKHVVGVIQLLGHFSETHGHRLTIAASSTVTSPTRGLSSEMVEALRRVGYFTVRIGTKHHTLLWFPVYIYRLREETLRCRGQLKLTHIPKAATARLQGARGGQYWPSELLEHGVPPKEPTEQVDIVYTWVDSTDRRWRALYRAFCGADVDEDRFSSRDELRYSMRSVHMYCGWVRKIFVVSNCAPPAWLNTRHEKIVWVDHEQVLLPENLPSFNCHAIETGLLRIPDLSDRFVYFNDDVFVTRALRRRAFFDVAGRSLMFLEREGKLAHDRRPEEESWYGARLTAQRLLLKHLGYAATRIAYHAPHAVTRARAQELFEEFASDVGRIAAQRVRSSTDMPLLSFLYGHYGIAKGHGGRREATAKILDMGHLEGFQLGENTEFLCINDGQGSAEHERFIEAAAQFMSQRFPHRAPWER